MTVIIEMGKEDGQSFCESYQKFRNVVENK